MIDITFITSNNAKLSHAKYLAAKYNVNILHYKKKFYGVGYAEPRLSNKMQVLKESMNDAIKRWKKNVSEKNTQLFFIEDTSVRINGLSTQDNDFPGADIKYWMQDNDFYKLDKALREKGNDREVIVTSHVVLFLTEDIKRKRERSDEYIMFISTSSGKITDKELVFETQILHPWLDNKTFNKWFVPNGFDIPISMLNISDVDKVDFRKPAFEEMFDFLEKYHVSTKNTARLVRYDNLFPFFPLFLISGPTCAGKSTIGKYLLERYGYYHIEASDFMTLQYLEAHGANFSIDKNIFAAEKLKSNPLVVVENVLKYIRSKNIYDKLIITGFRTSDEISYFRKVFMNQDIKIIYITSCINVRYNRWIRRKRDITEYTQERFFNINTIQNEMGLSKIVERIDAMTFENNQEGLEFFYANFKEKYINADFVLEKNNVIVISQNLQLEKTILVILAIEYKKNEYNYFTTTEISRLINGLFKECKKNKNNVSRYFNQSYYPYYEIKKEKGKNKYKLSPTGYSEANFISQRISQGKNSVTIDYGQ